MLDDLAPERLLDLEVRHVGNDHYEGTLSFDLAGDPVDVAVAGDYTFRHGNMGDVQVFFVRGDLDGVGLADCPGQWSIAVDLGCCGEEGRRSTVTRFYDGECPEVDFCSDDLEAVTRYMGEAE